MARLSSARAARVPLPGHSPGLLRDPIVELAPVAVRAAAERVGMLVGLVGAVAALRAVRPATLAASCATLVARCRRLQAALAVLLPPRREALRHARVGGRGLRGRGLKRAQLRQPCSDGGTCCSLHAPVVVKSPNEVRSQGVRNFLCGRLAKTRSVTPPSLHHTLSHASVMCLMTAHGTRWEGKVCVGASGWPSPFGLGQAAHTTMSFT